MTRNPTPIPTVYDGQRYRSRLEARWAAFFDLISWRWTYEPLDGDGYLPDFLVEGPAAFLVEVKPAQTREELLAEVPKTQRGLRHLDTDLLLVGASPFFLGTETIGLLSKEVAYGNWVQDACWTGCACGAHGWHAEEGSFRTRPCACYDGRHHLRLTDTNSLIYNWRLAGAMTQWPGRDSK